MNVTVQISDALLVRAKRHGQKIGLSLRVMIEEGLRRVLEAKSQRETFRLADHSVGDPQGPNPLASLAWKDLREEIYDR